MNCIHRIREYLYVRVQKWYKSPRISLFWVPLFRHSAQAPLLYHSIKLFTVTNPMPQSLLQRFQGQAQRRKCVQESAGFGRGTHPPDSPAAKGHWTQQLKSWVGCVWLPKRCQFSPFSGSSISFNRKNHLIQHFLVKAQVRQDGPAHCPNCIF